MLCQRALYLRRDRERAPLCKRKEDQLDSSLCQRSETMFHALERIFSRPDRLWELTRRCLLRPFGKGLRFISSTPTQGFRGALPVFSPHLRGRVDCNFGQLLALCGVSGRVSRCPLSKSGTRKPPRKRRQSATLGSIQRSSPFSSLLQGLGEHRASDKAFVAALDSLLETLSFQVIRSREIGSEP